MTSKVIEGQFKKQLFLRNPMKKGAGSPTLSQKHYLCIFVAPILFSLSVEKVITCHTALYLIP